MIRFLWWNSIGRYFPMSECLHAEGVSLSLQGATEGQIDEICELVNLAYRGKDGWTSETGMIAGQRVRPAEIVSALRHPQSHLLVCAEAAKVYACICVESKGAEAFLGLFAVAPKQQGKGLGKQILALAEAYAKELGATSAKMWVVRQRQELIAYYERRGYQRSGIVEDFPLHRDVGTPVMDGLSIELLHKHLL